MRARWLITIALAAGVPACTKLNPNACCTSPDDCASAGLPNGKTCENATDVCVNNACMPPLCTTDTQCSGATPYCVSGQCEACDATRGCTPAEPVCELATFTCGACGDDSGCSTYSASPHCDVTSGVCVACTTSAQCGAATPVCDSGACRGCQLDAECASGVCNGDGTCMSPSAIVYLDPNGATFGTCTQSAPCKNLSFAIGQTSPSRKDVVFANGTYFANATISTSTTSATSLKLHGAQSTLKPVSTSGPILTGSGVQVTVSDLVFTGATSVAAVLSLGGWELDNVTFHDTQCLVLSSGQTVVRNIHTSNANGAAVVVSTSASLVLDRGVISGGDDVGISIQGNTTQGGQFDITNLLVYGTKYEGLYLAYGAGKVAFTTVANCGSGVTLSGEANSVQCTSTSTGVDTFTSSIIWNTNTGRPTVVGSTCNFTISIVGAVSYAGGTNIDPMFDNSDVTHPYRISSSSYAKDAAPTGPSDDVDGDPRPQGIAYDLGAYEIP